MTASDVIEEVMAAPQLGDDAIGSMGDDVCCSDVGIQG